MQERIFLKGIGICSGEIDNDFMENPLLFRGKYRIPSTRLGTWNYGYKGSYFITIVTKNRVPWFGDIDDEKMRLSDIGHIADTYWQDIGDHFSHVTIDEYVVMPNHVHGIITINESINEMTQTVPNGGMMKTIPVETCESHVSTTPIAIHTIPSTTPPIITKNPIVIPRPPPGSIGSIIGQYKSTCTKQIAKMEYADFAWQPRFHDRIIRNTDELEAIRTYIRDNPKRWGQ